MSSVRRKTFGRSSARGRCGRTHLWCHRFGWTRGARGRGGGARGTCTPVPSSVWTRRGGSPSRRRCCSRSSPWSSTGGGGG
ncbi:hypothetical protein CJD44_28115, partial [Streptomyces sp. alain-838]